MKSLIQIKRRDLWKYFTLIVFTFILAACYHRIITLTQPSTAKAGTIMTTTLKVEVKVDEKNTAKLVVGYLVPKSWNARVNTTMTLVSTKGNSAMSLVPEGTIDPSTKLSWAAGFKSKFGIGSNLIDDMEWVVFQTNTTYEFVANEAQTGDVIITTKVGPDNLMAKLGYGIANSRNGLAGADYYNFKESSCFTVTDGVGDLTDFCNPQIGFKDPFTATDNDIIALGFDNNITTTGLSGLNDLYLRATAYTASGSKIEVFSITNKSKLSTAPGAEKWQITLWPREYFNLQDGESLTKIEYYFTDASGLKKVGYGNTADPFIYRFNCTQ